MSQSDHDPLLRALTAGDNNLPDGVALSRMGRLMREAARPPQAVDLWSRIEARLADEAAEGADTLSESDGAATKDEDDAFDALIDAWYNGDRAGAVAADPLLTHLSTAIREAARPLRKADLLPRVIDRLDSATSSRRMRAQLDPVSRWRIWGAVVAGHAAAFFALAALHVTIGQRPQISPLDVELAMRERDGYHRILPGRSRVPGSSDWTAAYDLPESWATLRGQANDLLALRYSQQTRLQARQALDAEAAAPLVEAGLAWLIAQQRADGSIGAPAPDLNSQISVQALAAQALLGEGIDDPQRQAASAALLGWLADQLQLSAEHLDGRSLGIALVALIEGSIQHQDAFLRRRSEAILNQHAHRLADLPGEGGLGGFSLLALELAAVAELRIPDAQRHRLHQRLARPLPPDVADVGRLGLAAFARQIHGARYSLSVSEQLERIAQQKPGSSQRLDLMAWYFPSLALRETRDRRWQGWNQALEQTLLPAFESNEQGQAWVPAGQVRYADSFAEAGSTMATAMSILLLQVPYRFIPLGG